MNRIKMNRIDPRCSEQAIDPLFAVRRKIPCPRFR